MSEGIYGAKAISLLRTFIENPEQLMIEPEIPPETIEELRLKPEYLKGHENFTKKGRYSKNEKGKKGEKLKKN